MIIKESVKADAFISFTSYGNFWATVNGNMNIEEGASFRSGSDAALDYFKHKVIKASVEVGVGSSLGVNVSGGAEGRVGGGGIPRSLMSNEEKQPLRAGWLLKKRDLFSGWRSRYFKVYVNRFEYYIEPNDTTPRGVIPLLDAKVHKFLHSLKDKMIKTFFLI